MALECAKNTTCVIFTKPSREHSALVAGLVTFYSLIVPCALVSNITVLISIFRRLVPRNAVNVCFASLAISDIIMVVMSPFQCHAYLNAGWVFGEFMCKFERILLEINFSASTLTLVVISSERFLLICYPRKGRRSLKTIYFILLGVWITAIVITSPLYHGFIVNYHVDEFDKTIELRCAHKAWPKRYTLAYYITYSIVIFLIPLLIMTFTHWRMSVAIRENERRVKQNIGHSPVTGVKQNFVSYAPKDETSVVYSEVSGEENGVEMNQLSPEGQRAENKASPVKSKLKRREKRIKAIKTLSVVSVAFFLIWSPFVIMRLLVNCGISVNQYAYKFSQVLILSSTAVNGFIYAYMSPPFQEAFRIILCCKKTS